MYLLFSQCTNTTSLDDYCKVFSNTLAIIIKYIGRSRFIVQHSVDFQLRGGCVGPVFRVKTMVRVTLQMLARPIFGWQGGKQKGNTVFPLC